MTAMTVDRADDWPVLACDVVDSTNAVAAGLLRDGRIASRVVVVAREQTAGRGTHGRAWVSPRDAGIYASFVAIPDSDTWPMSSVYTMAAGLACSEALQQATGLAVAIKPVNDLLFGRGKLGGILVETIVEDGRLVAVIVGVGINWRRAIRPLPPESLPAVCVEELVSAEAFARIPPAAFVKVLGQSLDGYFAALAGGGVGEVERRWDAATAWYAEDGPGS
jgi:BirA family biotin operon repressor/biotin-[acetyl-CoA-carboxylase] ligase